MKKTDAILRAAGKYKMGTMHELTSFNVLSVRQLQRALDPKCKSPKSKWKKPLLSKKAQNIIDLCISDMKNGQTPAISKKAVLTLFKEISLVYEYWRSSSKITRKHRHITTHRNKVLPLSELQRNLSHILTHDLDMADQTDIDSPTLAVKRVAKGWQSSDDKRKKVKSQKNIKNHKWDTNGAEDLFKQVIAHMSQDPPF